MRDNLSPEEKLLRLIRGEKKGTSPAAAPAQSNAKPGKRAAFKIEVPSFLKHPDARKIIFILLAVSCLFLISSFIYPLVALRKVKLPEVPKEKNAVLEAVSGVEQKPLEEYLKGVSGRQIFSNLPSAGGAGPVSGVAADLVKDINLVGVIAGDNPQAIIEDKKAQKTYYVTKGQFFGEFQVEDIQEGKIILNYRGQRFELYL